MTTPLRIAIVAVLVSCGARGAAPTSTNPGAEGSAPAMMAKKVAVSWGITQGVDSSDVFLQVTDETGAQVSHPAGTYPGVCKVIVPAIEMHAVMAVACAFGGTTWQLQAIVRGEDIIVMKVRADDGAKPDPMAREEVTRVTAPPGAAIEATPAP
jgi:hypothetical protein